MYFLYIPENRDTEFKGLRNIIYDIVISNVTTKSTKNALSGNMNYHETSKIISLKTKIPSF
jgi:hypothetical protein